MANRQVQQTWPEKGMETRGSDSFRMKTYVKLPEKLPRSAEVLAESEHELEWMMVEGADQFGSQDSPQSLENRLFSPMTFLCAFSPGREIQWNLEEMLP